MNSLSKTITMLLATGGLIACTSTKPQSYKTPVNTESVAVSQAEADWDVGIGEEGSAMTSKGNKDYIIGCASTPYVDVEAPAKTSVEHRPLGKANTYAHTNHDSDKWNVETSPVETYRSIDTGFTGSGDNRGDIVTECNVFQAYDDS